MNTNPRTHLGFETVAAQPPQPAVRLSLLKPTGHLTLGNYLGALRPMRDTQHADCFYGIADLHALTVRHDPGRLRALSQELATMLVAVGLDRSTLFVQSRVPAHTELSYLLEATAYTGELSRMIQFKEKSRSGDQAIRAALYTYPVLMAADILLYRPRQVPVGDDQRQHVELTRDIAQRFNTTYGPVFVVPEIVTPPVAARVMDLQDPTAKMAKSGESGPGVIYLVDPPDVVRRKVARAVTDSDTAPDAVRRDREPKPGVTNLLEILEACAGAEAAAGITTYGALKRAVTDAVVAELEPLQKSCAELAADPEHVRAVFAAGEERCRQVTAPVVAAAQAAMGLI
ncbi:tryptophan--tRNA ligase [Nocardioides speluncae]|uniref:tryptophan--tRNA ligase n=1 Tax=Nocardioides speluncae TaxID=2670337 RepID=UPI000D69E169|nr:tryptophan--tRNA ligase [Nocardioides speluncae]